VVVLVESVVLVLVLVVLVVLVESVVLVPVESVVLVLVVSVALTAVSVPGSVVDVVVVVVDSFEVPVIPPEVVDASPVVVDVVGAASVVGSAVVEPEVVLGSSVSVVATASPQPARATHSRGMESEGEVKRAIMRRSYSRGLALAPARECKREVTRASHPRRPERALGGSPQQLEQLLATEA
jgi:hypothetical protein